MELDVNSVTETSLKETDLIARTIKKQKGGSSSYLSPRHLRTYKDSLIYPKGIWEQHNASAMPPSLEDMVSNDEKDMDEPDPSILLSKAEKL
jgi:hypothetical protein